MLRQADHSIMETDDQITKNQRPKKEIGIVIFLQRIGSELRQIDVRIFLIIFLLSIPYHTHSESVVISIENGRAITTVDFPGTPVTQRIPNPNIPSTFIYVYEYLDETSGESFTVTALRLPENLGEIDRPTMQLLVDESLETQLMTTVRMGYPTPEIETDVRQPHNGNPSRYVVTTRNFNGVEIFTAYRSMAVGRSIVVAWGLTRTDYGITKDVIEFVNSMQ